MLINFIYVSLTKVIHEVELMTKMMESGKSCKKKLKLIVKCLRNTRDRQRIGSHIPTSPTTSRTDAVRLIVLNYTRLVKTSCLPKNSIGFSLYIYLNNKK